MNGNTKWILSLIALFIFIATGLGGYAVARVDIVQERMTKDYVQMVNHRSDISRIESGIARLDVKMDKVLMGLR